MNFSKNLTAKKIIVTATILALCPMLVLSCKKDKHTNNNSNLPFSNTIKGVILRDLDAEPAGQLGTPDNNVPVSNDSFMMIYPTPTLNVMCIAYKVTDTASVTAIITLYNALYPNAPQTYNGSNVGIENENLAGQVALSDTVNIPANSEGISTQFSVSNLPQGFYRMYIQFSNGQAFWDNAWILRP